MSHFKRTILEAMYIAVTGRIFITTVVDDKTLVPPDKVRVHDNGMTDITLNITEGAVTDLVITESSVSFKARFNGVSQNISVPLRNIIMIHNPDVVEEAISFPFIVDPRQEPNPPAGTKTDSKDSPPSKSSARLSVVDKSNNKESSNSSEHKTSGPRPRWMKVIEGGKKKE